MIKKIFLIAFSVITLVIVILWSILPSLIVNYIEKHDRELLGREITIEDIDINLLNASSSVFGFKLYEADGDSVFFGFEEMSVNISLYQLISKNLHVEEFELKNWQTRIIQKGNQFNFDDLIETINEKTESTNSQNQTSDFRFVIENVNVSKGNINYSSILYPLMSIDSVTFKLPFFSDTSTTASFESTSSLSTGGKVNLLGSLNLRDTIIELDLKTIDVDLRIVEPYLRPIFDFKEINGKYNSAMLISASLVNSEYLNISGEILNKEFELIDKRGKLIFSNDAFIMKIDTISFSEAIYKLNEVKVNGIEVDLEIFEEGNSFSNLMAEDTLSRNTSSLSDKEVTEFENPFLLVFKHVKEIVKSYDESSYRLDTFSIQDVSLRATDFTRQTKDFNYVIHDAKMRGVNLSSDDRTLEINFEAGLNKSGKVLGQIRPFTKKPKDLDLSMDLKALDLTPFSPYTIDYVDFPLENGVMSYDCEVEIRDQKLKSSNLIEIDDLEWGDQSKLKAENENIPLKLGTSLLKDINGKIVLDIPIQGDLKDPNFNAAKVVWRVVKNLINKSASYPFKIMGETFDFRPKDLSSIKFTFLQHRLFKNDKKTLDHLARILKSKKEINVSFNRSTKILYELQEYALNEMRYRYMFPGDSLPALDKLDREVYKEMLEVDKNDSAFNAFVFDQSSRNKGEVSIEKACIELVGEAKALEQVDRIGALRQQAIINYLKNEMEIDPKRIRFKVLPPNELKSNVSAHEFLTDFWVE